MDSPSEKSGPSVEDRVAALLDRYYEDALRYARSRVSGKLQAKVDGVDIAQSAARKVFEEARKPTFEFRSESEFRRYFLNAVQQKLVDKYRHFTAEKRKPEMDRTLLGRVTPPTPETPSMIIKVKEREEGLADAIGRLESDAAQAVSLYYLQRQSLQEVARTMDRSIGSVRNLLEKSLRQLAGILPKDL